jgi:hypothetical protein
MTNKRNQQVQPQLSEDDYPELLLRRFKKMDSIVENARAMNRRNGLEESLQDQYIQYDGDFIQRRKYNKWLEAVRSPQNSHFYQTAILKMAGLISDEPSSLDEKTYPYRVPNHLYRVMIFVCSHGHCFTRKTTFSYRCIRSRPSSTDFEQGYFAIKLENNCNATS